MNFSFANVGDMMPYNKANVLFFDVGSYSSTSKRYASKSFDVATAFTMSNGLFYDVWATHK